MFPISKLQSLITHVKFLLINSLFFIKIQSAQTHKEFALFLPFQFKK